MDADHNIPIDYLVTNKNDSKAMGQMFRRFKTILRTNNHTVLYDKGYHNGNELKTDADLGIDALFVILGIGRASQAPDPKYNSEYFLYNQQNDAY